MKRPLLAAVAGYLIWSVLWIGLGQGLKIAKPDLFGEGGSSTHVGLLIAFIAGSVVISLVAGMAAALIAKASPILAGRILAGALILTGLVVELGGWGLAPAWYHIVFLVLLMPATCAGARLVAARTRVG